ncbi:MAG: hypothetical protein WBV39_15250 [Rudaea sp.]
MRFLPLALLVALCTPMLASAAGSCTSQDFDTAVAPALPPGWTSSVDTGAASTTGWITRSVGYDDTSPNAAWLDDNNDYADISLYSAVYGVGAEGSPSITFRHSYVLWAPDTSPLYAGAYSGATLEVSINGGAFTDLINAGGSFSTGGYNAHLDANAENPIDQPPSGRAVWSGDSGGFITSTAVMPAAALGATVQFRWRLGTEGGSRSYDMHSGWWIDSVQYLTLGDIIFADGFGDPCTE